MHCENKMIHVMFLLICFYLTVHCCSGYNRAYRDRLIWPLDKSEIWGKCSHITLSLKPHTISMIASESILRLDSN